MNYYDIINEAITRILASQKGGVRVVNYIFFGEDDPEKLTVYLAFEDASSLDAAKKSGVTGQIEQRLREALEGEGYRISPNAIAFVSEEEIEESGGPWGFFE